jgi:hypothetical protein
MTPQPQQKEYGDVLYEDAMMKEYYQEKQEAQR